MPLTGKSNIFETYLLIFFKNFLMIFYIELPVPFQQTRPGSGTGFESGTVQKITDPDQGGQRTYGSETLLKGIVSRDFVVCFLVSFDRSDISKHQEWVLLLLKVRFSCLGVVSPGKWRLNLSKYGAHTQDMLSLFMSIITENPVKKNGAKS
jgi:hypothetical protein